MTFILPWPPSVNRYWRAYRGRVVLSEAGRSYREAVHTTLMQQGAAHQLETGRLSVSIEASAPDARRRDLDNLLKAVLDALNGVAWVDDSQIARLAIWWGERVPGGLVRVTVDCE